MLNTNVSIIENALNNLTSAVGLVQKDLTYQYVNRAFEKFFQMNSKDILGKKISDLAQDQFHIMILPFVQNTVKEEKKELIELIIPDKVITTSYRIINIELVPQINDKNKLEGIYLFISDITEFKTSAATAISKEKKLNALFNSLTQGVVLQDAQGKIIEFNRSALNILGLTKDQLHGKTSFDPYWRVINEDFTALPGESHPSTVALKTGQPVIGKIMGVYTSDEKISWMSVTAVPLFKNEEKTPSEVLITFEDLTKTKKLQQELKAKTYWQEAILKGIDYSIISTLPDGQIATFNKKAEEVLGYKSFEVIGKQTPEIFHLTEIRH